MDWTKVYKAVGAFLVGAACYLAPQPAEGQDAYISRRPESAEERATGGAGLAIDRHNPASYAFRSPGFGMELLSIDFDGGLSEFLRLRDVFDESNFDMLTDESLSPLERTDEFLALSDAEITLDARLYVEFLRMHYRHHDSTFFAGGYGDIEAGIGIAGPNALSSDSLVVEGYTLTDFIYMYDPNSPENLLYNLLPVILNMSDGPDIKLEIGDDFHLLRMTGRADIGCFAGYAHRLETPGGAEVGIGVQARYFHRWLSRYFDISVEGTIDSLDDIHIPQYQSVEGDGFALDLFTLIRLNDRYFNTSVSVGLDNLGLVWYDDGSVVPEHPRPSIGLHVNPLHILDRDEWGILADVENIGHGMATFQIGTYYAIPVRVNRREVSIVPRAGVEINGRDVLGEMDHDSVTAGVSANIGGSGIAGTFEYDFSNDTYRLGIGIWVGF